jgi:hypothetical protein
LSASFWVLTSQPSLPPLQSARPESHTWPHPPATQDGAALAQSSGQIVVQLPQRLMSVCVLVSQPSRLRFSSAEQLLQPGAQLVIVQLPAVQVGAPLAVLHGAAQAPQFASSVLVLVSHPSADPPEQLPQPGSHVVMLQVVPLHPPLALANTWLQLFPQAPQFRSLLKTLVSQPLRLTFSSAEQSAYPALQLSMLHCPAPQFGMPCV